MEKNDDIVSSKQRAQIFAFALKRTSNAADAEELSQEILLQCLIAARRGGIKNSESYFWSVAHNTYKRYLSRRKNAPQLLSEEAFTNIPNGNAPLAEDLSAREEYDAVKRALSSLAELYRKTLVYFYYDELPVTEIGKKLNLSESMVKFYLRAGRQKLKEVYSMNEQKLKSFYPADFCVYLAAIDFTHINVWEIFRRKLPCQLALECTRARSVQELSLATGVPAAYIEDEIEILRNADLMRFSGGKAITNFSVLKSDAVREMKGIFTEIYARYLPRAIAAYETYLPKLKQCDVFKFDAQEKQWKWFFASNVSDFYTEPVKCEDYPQTACGARAFIFAAETEGFPFTRGQTPIFLDNYEVRPCDVSVFGEFRRQEQLRPAEKSAALCEIYRGNANEEHAALYAELIGQGYAFKKDGNLFSNVPASTAKSRAAFQEMNEELNAVLQPLCRKARKTAEELIDTSLPRQLKQYRRGYTEIWLDFFAGVWFLESLHESGFLPAERGETLPLACSIYEK